MPQRRRLIRRLGYESSSHCDSHEVRAQLNAASSEHDQPEKGSPLPPFGGFWEVPSKLNTAKRPTLDITSLDVTPSKPTQDPTDRSRDTVRLRCEGRRTQTQTRWCHPLRSFFVHHPAVGGQHPVTDQT